MRKFAADKVKRIAEEYLLFTARGRNFRECIRREAYSIYIVHCTETGLITSETVTVIAVVGLASLDKLSQIDGQLV